MSLDLSYRAVRPARIPDQPVLLDLRAFGPKRMGWGVSTPLIVRSQGWEPTTATPATVQGCVQSMYGDWWVYVEVPLRSAVGGLLATSGMLLPPSVVSAVSPPARRPHTR